MLENGCPWAKSTKDRAADLGYIDDGSLFLVDFELDDEMSD
jgi:hypothetical protein|tara:strand:- start:5903 stop:6025 length:123 start_codon:yes stop_codon:yes gene_type:complete